MTRTKYQSAFFDDRVISVSSAVTVTRRLNQLVAGSGLDLKFDFVSQPAAYIKWRPLPYRVTVMHTDPVDIAQFKLANAHALKDLYDFGMD